MSNRQALVGFLPALGAVVAGPAGCLVVRLAEGELDVRGAMEHLTSPSTPRSPGIRAAG